MQKRCSKCGEIKPAAAFGKRSNRRTGLQSRCKACANENRRLNYQKYRIAHLVWLKANRDKIRALARKWKKANREKLRELQRKWHQDHPEYAAKWKKAHSEYAANWQKANPDKTRDSCARRRAKKKGATIEPVSRQVVYERDLGLCHICGRAVSHDNWHLDHVIPLCKGGEHGYRNVAVSHPLCNQRKNAA